MKINKHSIYITLVAFILFSCNKKESLEGFDDQRWKADPKACKNQRAELLKILLSKKVTLKEMDDDAISSLLGPPERNRQFSRGRKNYIYFTVPGSQCENWSAQGEGKKLVVEFDALGKVQIIRESLTDF